MCATPQMTNDHIIGWRVTANTPRASPGVPTEDSPANRSVASTGDSPANRAVAPAGDSPANRVVVPTGDSLAGRSVTARAPPGFGKAGLPISDPTSRTDAININ